jgi:nicotinate-nucleotide pyrophosphorylase
MNSLPLTLAHEVERNVLAALAEDIGGGDLTALLTPADRPAIGVVVVVKTRCFAPPGSTPAFVVLTRTPASVGSEGWQC